MSDLTTKVAAWGDFDSHPIVAATKAKTLHVDIRAAGPSGKYVIAMTVLKHDVNSFYGVRDFSLDADKKGNDLYNHLLDAVRKSNRSVSWSLERHDNGRCSIEGNRLVAVSSIHFSTKDEVEDKDIMYVCDQWAKKNGLAFKVGLSRA